MLLLPAVSWVALAASSLANPIATAHVRRSQQDYEVVVIGGGPSGLAALMSLGRVNRKALLIDSGDYRNAQTLHMHDVLGNDGTVPAQFRAKAREEIARYPSVSLMNGTVQSVQGANMMGFITTDVSGQQFSSKKVIFATGIKEIMPSTKGIADEWGRGIYWCTWCDGWEHRNQTLGKIGKFTAAALNGTLSSLTLNPNTIMFTNGSFTPENQAKVGETLPDWQEKLAQAHIGIEDRVMVSVGRVHGNREDLSDPLLVTFVDGSSTTVDAMKAGFPAPLSSDLIQRTGLVAKPNEDSAEARAVVDKNMESSTPGIFVVGDANSDGSSNVPHALWSAKRAVVHVHDTLAQEYADDLVRSNKPSRRSIPVEQHFSMRAFGKRNTEQLSADDFMRYVRA